MTDAKGRGAHTPPGKLELAPAQRRRLEAYAQAQGITLQAALALAVERLLQQAAPDDFLTAEDEPEDLF